MNDRCNHGILCALVFGVLVLISGQGSLHSARPESSKQPIGEMEFLNLVKADKYISDRIVPANAIISAIRWAQDAAKRGAALPKDGIQVYNCIVTGSFTFFKEDDSDEEKQNSLLVETSVKSLPPNLAERYVQAGIKSVVVVPVALGFYETEFRNQYWEDQTFNNTIFQGPFECSQVTFNNYVSFKNATFLKYAEFVLSSFREHVFLDGANFCDSANLAGVIFGGEIVCDKAVFEDDADWRDAKFKGPASFAHASFRKRVAFDSGVFESPAYFTETNVSGKMTFNQCKFKADAFFIDLNRNTADPLEGDLEFADVTFAGRVYFTNARIGTLSFFPQTKLGDRANKTPQQAPSRESASPVSFSKRAIFTGLRCDSADFRETEFREFADFSSAHFRKYVDFSYTSFEGDAGFYKASFPPKSADPANNRLGLVLDGIQLLKGSDLERKQIQGSINSKEPDTFKRIEDIFRRSANLEGQNWAMYQRRLLDGDRLVRTQWLANRIDCFFWGYGVRPMRLTGWIFVAFCMFTFVYWTQTDALAQGKPKLRGAWARVRFATLFSLQTSWKLGFGYSNSRTPLFKAITLLHSFGFKILILFLIKAFSNTSPLLNELVGKLVHV